MSNKNEHKESNFPENKKVKAKLRRGDTFEIAEMAGISVTYVRDMLNGRRRITDKVSEAIIKLLHKRKLLNECLDNMIETEEE